MQKKNQGFLVIILSTAFIVGCNKRSKDSIPVNPKVTHYSSLGYNYLFSIDNIGKDSLMPVFIAKSNAGFYKLIVKEFSKGNSITRGIKQIGEVQEVWSPSILNFNDLDKFMDYSLDEDGYLTIENFYEERRNANINNLDNAYNTMLPIVFSEDTIVYERSSKSYPWPSSHLKNIFNIKRKRSSSTVLYENFYKACLFKNNNLTYLLTSQPDNLETSTNGALLNFQIEDNYGHIIRTETVETNNIVTTRGGCDSRYADGLHIAPIANGLRQAPSFIFYRANFTDEERYQGTAYFTIMKPENYTNLFLASLKCEPTFQYLKFFAFKDNLFITSFSENNINYNCYLYKLVGEKFEKYEIKLQNINGIFGNENGIIVAIKNEDKGLDIIQIN